MSDHSKTEFDDLNRELSGANSSKAIRFFDEDSTPRGREEKERKEAAQRQFDNLLQQLMNDPAYRQAWEEANDALDQLQIKLTNAMDQIAERAAHLENLIDDFENKAARLEDGTPVFRDENGQIVFADGTPLSATDAARVEIPDNAPSWEQYRDARDALDKVREKQDHYSDIQRDILTWRDRLNDPDNPVKPEEIKQLTKQANDYERDLERSASIKVQFDQNADAFSQPELINPQALDIKSAP